MILPIVAYGTPVLRKKAEDIDADYPKLKEILENMFETMYNAHGVGLAAPQVGLGIRIFIVDCTPFSEDEEEDNAHLKGFKKVFINPQITDEDGEEWAFTEGCLSIPDIREDVKRQPNIKIQYFDENFKEHTETYDGLAARVIQHEYDHIEGVLFTDKINPMRRSLLRGRLQDITKGNVRVDYKMKFPAMNKRRR